MIVIADTGPINYLILIQEIQILPVLYGRILVPASVCDELKHRAPLMRCAPGSTSLRLGSKYELQPTFPTRSLRAPISMLVSAMPSC